jgi:hypothetical protein
MDSFELSHFNQFEHSRPDYRHSVIVYFNKSVNDLDELHHFEDKLYDLLTDPEIGYYDGHEICTDLTHGWLFFYGHNAETLFKTVKPLLESEGFLAGAVAELMFGSEDGEKLSIELKLGEP